LGTPLRIAVLGDLHGHLTLAYRLLRRWERETGHTVDLILQVGDLGVFPPPFRIDKATMRFAEKDPDELGFVQYHDGSPEADAILGPDAPEETRIHASLYFVKGNHEDFEFLDGLAATNSPVPVDAYGRILFLPSGSVAPLPARDHRVRVAALGGLALQNGPGVGTGTKHYSKSEVQRLWAAGSGLDVLLTHDSPLGTVYDDAGSRDILEFIREFQPRFHFCGHHHEDGRQLDVSCDTQSFLLNGVDFRTPSELNPGCIGILEWGDSGGGRFAFLEEKWLGEYSRYNFRFL
jgi:Icc-related predicted phosphoesterase